MQTYKTQTPYKLEMRGVSKRFGSVQANKNVDLRIKKGETHVLLGENGAGKTTLMNILYGLYQADEGSILIDGAVKDISCPKDAIELGIGMVHQHFMLVHNLTVVENIILGNEPLKRRCLDIKRAEAEITELSSRYGFDIDPKAVIEDLSVGKQQKVEILKLLYRGADILILDEPTAVLTPSEINELGVILRNLNREGKSVILITHKLKEVMSMSESITVLRHGQVAGSAKTREASVDSIIEMMVGKRLEVNLDVERHNPGEPVLQISDITVLDSRDLPAVNGLSLTVHAGEILGLAGVDGNGQSELVEAIMGIRKLQNGAISLCGKDISNAKPKDIIGEGVACIPEDRQASGLILSMPLYENALLGSFDDEQFSRGMWVDYPYTMRYANSLIEQFDVRTPDVNTNAMWLSGGNQQKFVVARELSRSHKLLIAAQPTRGVDIGARQFIHKSLIADRDAGKAVLLISTELDEILELSDRIAVIYNGKIVAIFKSGQADDKSLGMVMAGNQLGEAVNG